VDDNLDPDEFVELQECRGLLLDAGADPTLTVDPNVESAIHDAAKLGSIVSQGYIQLLMLLTLLQHTLRLLLDRGGYFVNLEAKDEFGRTPLLLLARRFEIRIKTEMISLLLSYGANVKAYDKFGETCLHATLSGSMILPNAREALIILINAGADVNAEDNRGYSVSEYTYHKGHGKLWQEVLIACGFNAAEVCGDFYQDYDLEEAGSHYSDEPSSEDDEDDRMDTRHDDDWAVGCGYGSGDLGGVDDQMNFGSDEEKSFWKARTSPRRFVGSDEEKDCRKILEGIYDMESGGVYLGGIAGAR